MAKKLIKSKSNFTLRRLHQSGDYGNIYERDYTTIVTQTPISNSQIPIYNSPSFKLTVRAGLNKKKKYSYGNWLQNPENCGGNGNLWSLDCMPKPSKTDSKIILKPNTHRLTDFACYGSATELIRASLTNIVSNYPAELYFTTLTLGNSGLLNTTSIPDGCELMSKSSYYVVDNPMFIDLTQQYVPDDSQVSKLRYFGSSFLDYEIISGVNTYNITGINITLNEAYDNNICLNNGDKIGNVVISGDMSITIEIYYYEGNLIYISKKSNLSIRPKKYLIEDFYNKLSDFEKILLDRNNGFCSKFETYVETEEDGWYITEKDYKWPTANGGWNLSINGLSYNDYIEKLLDLSFAYDEFYCNSIWRDMTHESISNMDLTYSLNNDLIDSSKLKQAINVIGRQFDEIKKYADNIKNSNNVTYNQSNNKPDYFLTSDLDLSGWETKEILNEIPDDEICENEYDGRNVGFTANEANNEFMRRLKLNSKNILRKKGTKQAIEELMAIFGFHSLDWLNEYGRLLYDVDKHRKKAFKIEEYVYVATSYNFKQTDNGIISGKSMVDSVKIINQLKDSYNIEDINYYDGILKDYQGLPIAEVEYNGVKRLVPWFDKDTKYDGNIYYQMNGGWGLYKGEEKYCEISKEDIESNGVNINTIKTFTSIPSTRQDGVTGNTENSNGTYYYIKVSGKYYEWKLDEKNLYEKTISNVRYVENKNELYDLLFNELDVNDLYYVNEDDEYYKIKIDENTGKIINHRSESGWTITTDENDIYYANNIIENNKGNNPHFGNYDRGISYLESLANLFKNSTFENARSDEGSLALNCGFNISKQTDTTKCLHYTNNATASHEISLLRKDGTYIRPRNLFDGNEDNAQREESYSELSSLSVINSKELHITFDLTYKDLIEKDILPYLKQIIPSTTIFSYSFRLLDSLDGIFEAKKHRVICDGGICSIYGVVL